MEVVLSVPEAELEDFSEEATESSGQQTQPSESSQTQGTVKSLLSVKLFPMADLLEKIRRGKLSYLDLNGATPKAKGDQLNIRSLDDIPIAIGNDHGRLSLTSL